MKKQVVVSLDQNIYNHLQTVLNANNTNLNTVMENLIKLYLKDYFESAAKECDTDIKLSSKCISGKAFRKIPRWAADNKLNAHKIIRAFLLLNDICEDVPLVDLKDACSDERRQDIYVPKFSANYAQMKFDSEKSLGKVFYEKDGYVKIHSDVKEHILKHKKQFVPELSYCDDIDFSSLNAKEIAEGVFRDILQSDKVSIEEIEYLCSPAAADYFNINELILVKADQPRPDNYYAKPIKAHGQKYYLVAQWFRKSRDQLIKWIERHI